MKTELQFRPRAILAMLLVGLSLDAISVLLLDLCNEIVNTDLYNFGLQYSLDWSIQFGTYYDFSLGFLVLAVAAVAVALALVAIYTRRRVSLSGKLSLGMMIFGSCSTILSAFFFTRLDHVVNSYLYNYGLRFSYEWAMRYWTYAYSIVSLQAAMIGLTLFSGILLFLGTRVKTRLNMPKMVQSIMLLSGAISLVFAVAGNSVILAFIGLGLAFWGGILVYIRSEDYAKKTILDSIVVSSTKPLDEIIKELDYVGISVYLPPSYLRDPEMNIVCILKQKDSRLPLPSDIQGREPDLLIDDPPAILVTPVGSELVKLFEEALNSSLTKVEVQYLQQNLQKLLVENLEIAQEARMEIENDKIRVFLEKSILIDAYKRLQKQPYAMRSLGTPISSAIGCSLAKASGKPVTITRDEITDDGKTICIEFRLLNEPEEEHLS